jgi:formylglycine-generating enzyme required for sulfatase activity
LPLPQHSPALADHGTATELARLAGCRLPTEAEWEYLCRGGEHTLFPWADELASSGELEQWMSMNYDFQPGRKPNGYGLYHLFAGEWCADEYRESHQSDAPVRKGVRVTKGGAAGLGWPWQGCEWLWCLPCMRMPDTAHEDRHYAVRLIRDLT